ncbi:dihydrodipicolinate synthase family protein [uncultured Sphaerochaeta sp.]|uniref:dihydrodipicolinate synthase family protein n=1 Tax=uncultured Sphaerochaeta sp. TaxID=886478 RepID=UPI002A0A1B30|nr:dihydrodipicolinate synthase family protein [uncultured Sphaerochaeta sp.]
MINKKIEGIVPVMLTPYKEDGSIDYASVERLIEWYIQNGSDALFAVCQSSEMYFLSLKERAELASFVVQHVQGRIPVVASGHISDDPYSQIQELQAAVASGADGIVLVSNHLDPRNQGKEVFLHNLQFLLDKLPNDLPLGIYECPAPYRRLISDEELMFLANSGRFTFMKDVSCDLATVTRRVKLTQGSGMVINNANAAIAWDAMKAGAKGFNGVNTNFHPDLYKWLYTKGNTNPEFAKELANFLVLSALSESYGYPVIAKMYHQRLGNFSTIKSRTYTGNIYEKVWAVEPILDKVIEGTEYFRTKIKAMA